MSSDSIKVFCRFRPLNQREKSTEGGTDLCVKFKGPKTCAVDGINKVTGAYQPIDYNFDATFDPDSRQVDVYTTAVAPILDSILDGYNGTIFAYG